MSSPNAAEIRQLSQQAQPFTADRERRPSTFLSLTPNTSESHPRTQKAKDTTVSALTADALTQATKEGDSPVLMAKQHRTSSLSSDGSKTRLRFLKLGPVHWGEHQGAENQGDWHEVAVE